MDDHIKQSLADEVLSWIEQLTPYLKGEKKWDTGCIWVCESHPLSPYDMGYSFDCTCGAPGMSPFFPETKRKEE